MRALAPHLLAEVVFVVASRSEVPTEIRSHLPALFAGANAGAIILAARTPTAGPGVVHDEVVTRRLVVVDAAGKERVLLTVTEIGPVLGLYDAAGETRTQLAAWTGSTALTLHDAAGRPRPSQSLSAPLKACRSHRHPRRGSHISGVGWRRRSLRRG